MSIDTVVAALGIAAFVLYVALALWFAADTRDDADGSTALGRREHRPSWW